MWKLFKGKEASETQSKEGSPQECQASINQFKKDIENKLQSLTKQFRTSQQLFKQHYLIDHQQSTLCTTFQQLMATIQGLIAIIQELKVQYDDVKDQLHQNNSLKNMLNNHQNIITSIQDSHSTQISQLYHNKKTTEENLNLKISELQQKNQLLLTQLQHKQHQLFEEQSKIQDLQLQLSIANQQKKDMSEQLSKIQQKYSVIMSKDENTDNKRIVDPQHLQVQQKIIAYLDVQDLVSLQQTNKFYNILLKKQESKHFYYIFKRKYQLKLTRQITNAKYYQKIYELFPNENIKINAFKYLYFKIKPATYILPYLQEEQLEILKRQQQDQQSKQKSNKFSWKSLFNSQKKIQKKQEHKFNLNNLKNQQDFKKIQNKIEIMFKNILHIDMPQDLQYFSQTMQKQLQELKQELGQYRQGRNGQLEWTAQLYCLSRYMYHQINELYSLLQVIFGQLLHKNKTLITLQQNYQYIQQNEIVLRNLIENISNDKAIIQKKMFIMENQIVKKSLQKETLIIHHNRFQQELQQVKRKYQSLQGQHSHCKKHIQKFIEDRRHVEMKMSLIRQEVDNLEKGIRKPRKNSGGSVGSSEFMNETGAF